MDETEEGEWVDVVGGRGKLARAANWFQSEPRGTFTI